MCVCVCCHRNGGGGGGGGGVPLPLFSENAIKRVVALHPFHIHTHTCFLSSHTAQKVKCCKCQSSIIFSEGADLLKDEIFAVAELHPMPKQYLQGMFLRFIKEVLIGRPEVGGDATYHVLGAPDTFITTFHDVATVQGLVGCGV